MTSLTFFLVILGVCLPSAFSQHDECAKDGDGTVDWTKETQTWYYCQTSIKDRKSNNCYVTFTKAGDKSTNAATHSYDLQTEKEGTDNFLMESTGPGLYKYPERETSAKNIKVSSDGNCLTYWKCHGDKGAWNGVPGNGAYFMSMCKNQDLCKPQKEYTDNYKEIFDAAKKELNIEIFDLDQNACNKLNIKPQ